MKLVGDKVTEAEALEVEAKYKEVVTLETRSNRVLTFVLLSNEPLPKNIFEDGFCLYNREQNRFMADFNPDYNKHYPSVEDILKVDTYYFIKEIS